MRKFTLFANLKSLESTQYRDLHHLVMEAIAFTLQATGNEFPQHNEVYLADRFCISQDEARKKGQASIKD
jgi:hypothetical protein